MGINWNDTMVNFLINEVKQHPHIWNSNCPLYKNILKRQQFWSRTTQKLNKQFLLGNNPCTHGEITKKWNNLKRYYKTEKQRVINAKLTAVYPDDFDEDEDFTWKYASAMEFLSNDTDSDDNLKNIRIKVRSDLFKYDADDGDNSEDTMNSTSSSKSNLSTTTTTSRKRKHTEPLKELEG